MKIHEDFRTIEARGVVLSHREMVRYRIRGVYNAIGEAGYMTPEYIEDFANKVHRPFYGEVAIVETSLKDHGKGNPLVVLSVIVFADVWSWNMFAMANQGIYYQEGKYGDIFPLLN